MIKPSLFAPRPVLLCKCFASGATWARVTCDIGVGFANCNNEWMNCLVRNALLVHQQFTYTPPPPIIHQRVLPARGNRTWHGQSETPVTLHTYSVSQSIHTTPLANHPPDHLADVHANQPKYQPTNQPTLKQPPAWWVKQPSGWPHERRSNHHLQVSWRPRHGMLTSNWATCRRLSVTTNRDVVKPTCMLANYQPIYMF